MELADPLVHWPFTLNTGRYRDQWHTMTRTGLSARLSAHRREPLVEIHPDDAANLGIADPGLASLITAQGECIYRVQLSDGHRRGEAFVPLPWTDQQSTGGRTARPTRPTVDPYSGQPGLKSSAPRHTPLLPQSHHSP